MKITIMAVVALVFALTIQPRVLVAQDVNPEPVVEVEKTVEQHLEEIFGAKAKIAKAVILHESQNKLDAIGYNCIYYREDGTRYSTSCRKGDAPKAWSVDCGIGQINVKGKVCPEELLTLEGNMDAIEKIYQKQGLNAWVSYTTGRYKKYL